MQHHKLTRIDLVLLHRFLNRLAAHVHVRTWLVENQVLVWNLGDEATESFLKLDVVVFGKGLEAHDPDVVSCVYILSSSVSKTYNQLLFPALQGLQVLLWSFIIALCF